jgi:hypothetical protein
MSAARLALAMGLLVCAAACVTESADTRVVTPVPDRATFPPVSDLLDRRCGTLDCHGVTYRNLRIYGREGLRLAPTDRPSSKPGTTTVAEYDATFASLVGLEPELTGAVVTEGGARPERLTFVRKARGTEEHKGLAIWAEGGLEDLCVTTWLAGKIDTATCTKALAAR